MNQDTHARKSHDPRAARLGDPTLAAGLRRFVRSRAPDSEVEDIVQSTLADALASRTAPDGPELQPWLYGIARNKIADLFRRSRREAGREPLPAEEVAAAESAPVSARDLLRWAEKELPQGEASEGTLEWMLREGEGEKLESIAAEENVPAPRVRQRVARLRKHFRARWAAQLAAVAVLVAVAAFLVSRLLKKDDVAKPEPPAPPPSAMPLPPSPAPPTPEERAAELRQDAFRACDSGQWFDCRRKLDEASRLDPAGDTAPDVVRARRRADDGLRGFVSLDPPHKREPSAPSSEMTTPAVPVPTAAPRSSSFAPSTKVSPFSAAPGTGTGTPAAPPSNTAAPPPSPALSK